MMQFNGHTFRKSKTVVLMPVFNAVLGIYYSYVDKNKTGYAIFGKVVPHGKKIPKNAYRTHYSWPVDGSPVYATLIPLDGYSLTNMAYGKDGRIYMAYDANVYICKR